MNKRKNRVIKMFVLGIGLYFGAAKSQNTDSLSYEKDILLLRGTFQGVEQDPLVSLALTMKHHPPLLPKDG